MKLCFLQEKEPLSTTINVMAGFRMLWWIEWGPYDKAKRTKVNDWSIKKLVGYAG